MSAPTDYPYLACRLGHEWHARPMYGVGTTVNRDCVCNVCGVKRTHTFAMNGRRISLKYTNYPAGYRMKDPPARDEIRLAFILTHKVYRSEEEMLIGIYGEVPT